MGQDKYKVVNGTSYHKETPDAVINVLEAARKGGFKRIKLHYGDTETGRDWKEEYDVTGYVGRSGGGQINVPILLHNTRSLGGGAILDHCIVKIKEAKGGRVLYKHPKYQELNIDIVPSDMKEYEYNTVIDGQLHGRHKSMQSAKRLKNLLS